NHYFGGGGGDQFILGAGGNHIVEDYSLKQGDKILFGADDGKNQVLDDFVLQHIDFSSRVVEFTMDIDGSNTRGEIHVANEHVGGDSSFFGLVTDLYSFVVSVDA
ncbi:MAG TPA: hypothetical protein QF626_09735, partial [Prochlorococcaceae cyanobacterium Fu_MAG_50]|nr:hypothetical protein [Prochlorococcaceae cyanobacterium Fu_MAG_50]